MYRRPTNLGYVIHDVGGGVPVIYLFPFPHGPACRIYGTAALIWALAIEGEEDVAAAAAELTEGADVDGIRPDVNAFLNYLKDNGFLLEEPQ